MLDQLRRQAGSQRGLRRENAAYIRVTQAVADRHTDGWTDGHCATIRASLACASQAKNANGLDTG